jgi:hypothetical protein
MRGYWAKVPLGLYRRAKDDTSSSSRNSCASDVNWKAIAIQCSQRAFYPIR